MGDELGRRVAAGIGREEPVEVGQQHEHVGAHEVGHERGEPVVVAEADLVVGHRVVLVDHRHAAELEQADERLAGVQVLAAVDEVVRAPGAPGAATAPCSARERIHVAIMRGWPSAASACRVGRSAGRWSRPSAATPADTAPELTTTTWWPCRAHVRHLLAQAGHHRRC